MIRNDEASNGFIMICDKCKTEHLFDTNGDWKKMIDESRKLGWKSKKVGTRKNKKGLDVAVWEHACPKCQG